MNIVLVGFMCSGKSRVGRELAARLGWKFQDTDELVTQAVGMRVQDIIRKRGEGAFRDAEAEAVKRLAEEDRAVIATGGGVPLNPDNMKALAKNGQIIWLKVTPRTVLRRAGDLTSRPLIDSSDPLGSVTKRLREREPLYEASTQTIETDSLTPAQVVEKIVSLIPALQ